MKAAVFDDGTGLVVVDVGMAAQLIERQGVDVQTMGLGMADDKVGLGRRGEVGNLVELIDADIAAEPSAVIDNLLGKVSTDARHASQLGGVGRVEDNGLAGGEFVRRETRR